MRHTWYACSETCNGCMFCDGGLSACTVCGGFEGTLTEHCAGNKLPEFTLDKVYAGELDFVNGAWVRPSSLIARMRGKTVAEARELWEEVAVMPSMQRAQVIIGW